MPPRKILQVRIRRPRVSFLSKGARGVGREAAAIAPRRGKSPLAFRHQEPANIVISVQRTEPVKWKMKPRVPRKRVSKRRWFKPGHEIRPDFGIHDPLAMQNSTQKKHDSYQMPETRTPPRRVRRQPALHACARRKPNLLALPFSRHARAHRLASAGASLTAHLMTAMFHTRAHSSRPQPFSTGAAGSFSWGHREAGRHTEAMGNAS